MRREIVLRGKTSLLQISLLRSVAVRVAGIIYTMFMNPIVVKKSLVVYY